jgi:NhaP-type Na+/H+ or K+/H+ antiporter
MPQVMADQIMAITLAAVAASVVLHGITVRPMMYRYWKRKPR